MSGRARPQDPLETWCEARIPGHCEGRAVLRHHLAGRLKSPTLPDPDAASNTRDLCNQCHLWAHANPQKAYERDLLRKRLSGVPYIEEENG